MPVTQLKLCTYFTFESMPAAPVALLRLAHDKHVNKCQMIQPDCLTLMRTTCVSCTAGSGSAATMAQLHADVGVHTSDTA